MAAEKSKDYKPCTACGDTEVERHVHGTWDETREGVFTTCKGCGNRRGSWTRKRKGA